MAAVTLKDLMDPLTKIQAATESTATELSEIVTAVTSSGQIGAGVQSAILSQLTLQSELLKDSNQKFSQLVGGSKGGDKLGKGGEALKILGAGTFSLAKGLLAFTLVPEKTVVLFEKFLTVTLAALENVKVKQVEKGTEALLLMGTSLLKFSKNLAVAALLLIPATIGIPLLYASVGLVTPLFILLGKFSRSIRSGARSMRRMGRGLRSFGIGLAVFALSTMFIITQPKLLLAMAASLVLIGGAVAILGLKAISKPIRRGSLNLIILGVGLAAFGLGYAVFAGFFPKNTTMGDVLIQAAVVALIGGAAGLVGLLGLRTILTGAAALVANGLALAVFVIGYKPFAAATKGMDLLDVAVQGAVILAIGAAVAVLGMLGLAPIAIGALSLGLVGVGLLLFSFGYTPFAAATKGMTWTGVGIQLTTLAGIGAIFTAIGVANAAVGLTGFIGPAFFAAAGLALIELTKGLKAIKNVGMSETDTDNLVKILTVVSAAFAGTSVASGPMAVFKGLVRRLAESGSGGGAALMFNAAGRSMKQLAIGLDAIYPYISGNKAVDGNKLGEVLGAIVTGFTLDDTQAKMISKGIRAVKGAGDELVAIGIGLTKFDKMEFSAGLTKKVKDVLNVVGKAFGAIGEDVAKDSGVIWDDNNVREGVKAVRNAGDVLIDLTAGLDAFAGLADPKDTGKKIGEVLTVVGDAFSVIGGKVIPDSGVIWDDNAIAEGVKAVRNAGEVLKDLAMGVGEFAKMKDGKKSTKTIEEFLTGISNVFSSGYTNATDKRLDKFTMFINDISKNAANGRIAKAAKGIEAIAKAVNQIDVNKAIAFGDLFEASGKIPEGNVIADDQYDKLSDLVQEIADAMGEIKVSSGGGGTGNDLNLKNTLRNLNKTVGQLNSSVQALPSSIATATFEVVDNS